MNNKIVRISALCVLMSACAFAQKRNNFYPNELNEVVISDSKFALAKEKWKGNCKITSEELSKKSGQSLAAILSTVAGLKLTETRVVQVKLRLLH
jgi:vitamin B12 transporter